MAESFGMDILQLKELEEKIGGFEYIYNTIPALVLSAGMIFFLLFYRGKRYDKKGDFE